jgi:HTH-type transcriptional regulator / antitoxin HipB
LARAGTACRVMQESSFSESLATEVLRRRRELGLKQVELAELAGCSTRFVHTVEAGKPGLRLESLLRVLAVLGLRLEVQGPRSLDPDRGQGAH